MQRAEDRPHAHKLYLSWENRDLTIGGEVADIAAIELDLERATGSPACKGEHASRSLGVHDAQFEHGASA